MKNVKEQLKDRITESSQLMISTDFPHTYYRAVGVEQVEQIIDEVLEVLNEQTAEKEEI